LQEASEISERPGEGLRGTIAARKVQITSRGKLATLRIPGLGELPPPTGGLECVITIDGRYAATYRFHDEPREDSVSFIAHLQPKHHIQQVMILSGDRESEVRHLAQRVGITDALAEKTPEQKLDVVKDKTHTAKTLYVGDGINDAPSLMAATVGIAIGQHSEVTSEAADVVVMDSSLTKVDEFIHISRRMRSIALQSAVGGMVLSVIGMGLAAAGHLPPVAGAIAQEIIDILAVLNALRAAIPPSRITDV
jgi:P-type E1-E2 ATPase